MSFQKLLGHSLFKACSQQLWATLTAAFWKTLLKILRIWINIRANSLWGNYHETNIDQSASKVAQKSESALRTTFHQYRTWHFTYFYTLLFLSNKLKFYISFSVDWIIFARIYLHFYRSTIIYYSRNLGVHPVPLRFFWKKN